MPVVTMRQLLEAGVHFGHQTRRWNPKMKRYIFTERNGIYILDLQQTMSGIERAYRFTRDLVAGGGTILFVATKRQVQEKVEEQAIRCGMRELEEMVTTGSIDHFPKKEALSLRREYEKLARNLSGLRNLDKAPDAVFILDTKKEEIAVREARKLAIPIVAVLDTNCDPDDVDYEIPGNDDAIRSGELLTRIIADAVIEGKSMRPADLAEDAGEAPVPEPAEVLPGAAAEPKAEWELQLEAEEAAEEATKQQPDQAAEKGEQPTPAVDPAGDEPGDASHPRPKSESEKG